MLDATRPTTLRKTSALLALVLGLAIVGMVPQARATDDLSGYNTENCQVPPVAVMPLGIVIALDPGHGGTDPGTKNTVDDDRNTLDIVESDDPNTLTVESTVTLFERNLNLDIADRTADLLAGQGYTVCLTRINNDKNPTNTQRAQFANSKGAKLFVLIHLNGSSNDATNYTQTFWGKKIKDLKFSDHMYNKALLPSLGIDGNGVGQFASGALLKSNMPATLTESVFLTNDVEAGRLVDSRPFQDDGTTPTRRQQIAQALAAGISTYP